MTKQWLPLEANPEALTAYAASLGIPEGYKFYDVLGTEDWALDMIPPGVVSFLLLYPLSEASELERTTTVCDATSPGTYFMKQNIGNACGTIAILHALLNMKLASDPSLFHPSSYISRMYSTTKDMSGIERGVWLENETEIEKAHTATESMGQSAVPTGEDGEVDTHFICFSEVAGVVYEFDGRRSGPVNRGRVETDFGKTTLGIIRDEFIARNPDDIRFSILALCKAD
jgi:ubiquitin carboxyl-terminal hydrolase L3